MLGINELCSSMYMCVCMYIVNPATFLHERGPDSTLGCLALYGPCGKPKRKRGEWKLSQEVGDKLWRWKRQGLCFFLHPTWEWELLEDSLALFPMQTLFFPPPSLFRLDLRQYGANQLCQSGRRFQWVVSEWVTMWEEKAGGSCKFQSACQPTQLSHSERN